MSNGSRFQMVGAEYRNHRVLRWLLASWPTWHAKTHVVRGVWSGEVGICDERVCVLFVSSTSGIVFNRSAGTIADRSQSAKDIDPYFKSRLCVEDTGHRKPVLILPNGPSKPEERANDRSKFLPWAEIEFRTHSRQSSVLPLSYQRSLIIRKGEHFEHASRTSLLDWRICEQLKITKDCLIVILM